MKKAFLPLLLLFIFSAQLHSQCPSGNVNFYSQSAVSHFATLYPNCTEISGNVYISGHSINDF
jgi:uncharacterized PurR-regulated membrane protein YhhQ (DUF165 family)